MIYLFIYFIVFVFLLLKNNYTAWLSVHKANYAAFILLSRVSFCQNIGTRLVMQKLVSRHPHFDWHLSLQGSQWLPLVLEIHY